MDNFDIEQAINGKPVEFFAKIKYHPFNEWVDAGTTFVRQEGDMVLIDEKTNCWIPAEKLRMKQVTSA
jgi:hypothetical protein